MTQNGSSLVPGISRTPTATERTGLPKSGYWKVPVKDRKVKARGTNNVIGTKGRVRGGVRTNRVMHEYHPTVNLPHQLSKKNIREQHEWIKSDQLVGTTLCWDEGPIALLLKNL
ncbi:nac domain-containing protein 62 [Quercus suber]|uniref:Nac domain-containing protein 62 n=1 Tax=Quercus suber TaxID=58331 RepID=A0AAW0MGG0_QUESU